MLWSIEEEKTQRQLWREVYKKGRELLDALSYPGELEVGRHSKQRGMLKARYYR